MTGVGSSLALAACETSQVLLVGVSSVFSRGLPVFAPPTDWPVSYELVKLNEKKILKEMEHFLCVFDTAFIKRVKMILQMHQNKCHK